MFGASSVRRCTPLASGLAAASSLRLQFSSNSASSIHGGCAPTFEGRGLLDPSLFRTQAFVGGVWKDASDGSTFDVLDPATGNVIASVAACGTEEVVTYLSVTLGDSGDKTGLLLPLFATSCLPTLFAFCLGIALAISLFAIHPRKPTKQHITIRITL
jgi:hypothetical protein